MIMIKTLPSMVASIETANTSDQQVYSNNLSFRKPLLLIYVLLQTLYV